MLSPRAWRRSSVGDPVLAETEVGPLITPHESDRVSTWIDEASRAAPA